MGQALKNEKQVKFEINVDFVVAKGYNIRYTKYTGNIPRESWNPRKGIDITP